MSLAPTRPLTCWTHWGRCTRGWWPRRYRRSLWPGVICWPPTRIAISIINWNKTYWTWITNSVNFYYSMCGNKTGTLFCTIMGAGIVQRSCARGPSTIIV
jgi:hypothetical protein